jgi:hypothetical protein
MTKPRRKKPVDYSWASRREKMVFGFDENMSWLLAISYTSIFSVILDRVMKQKFPFSYPGIEFWNFSHDDYSF